MAWHARDMTGPICMTVRQNHCLLPIGVLDIPDVIRSTRSSSSQANPPHVLASTGMQIVME